MYFWGFVYVLSVNVQAIIIIVQMLKILKMNEVNMKLVNENLRMKNEMKIEEI